MNAQMKRPRGEEQRKVLNSAPDRKNMEPCGYAFGSLPVNLPKPVANDYLGIVHPMSASSRRWLKFTLYALFRNEARSLFKTCFTAWMERLCQASSGVVDQQNTEYGLGV